MLASQRELALKKRQNSHSAGMIHVDFSSCFLPFLIAKSVHIAGMVRSSIESNVSAPSPMRSSGDGQFTPAIRQFSAPKSVLKDAEYVT